MPDADAQPPVRGSGCAEIIRALHAKSKKLLPKPPTMPDADAQPPVRGSGTHSTQLIICLDKPPLSKRPGSEVRRPVDWKKASHFRPHMGIQFPMGPG